MFVFTSLAEALRQGWMVYDMHYDEKHRILLRRKRADGQFELALCEVK